MSEQRIPDAIWKFNIALPQGKKILRIELFMAKQWQHSWKPYKKSVNPFDPQQNINGGTRFLRSLLDRYNGNVELSLAAYNAGPKRVEAAGGVPRIPETREYIARVLQNYRGYK